jgi:hypothetical protein
MTTRLGTPARSGTQALAYGEKIGIGEVEVTLFPAGHVLGSAQVLIEWKGARAVASGDYKRSTDPTCLGFEIVPCDLFVTEATFALPVFQHSNAGEEVAKLLRSREQFPDRAHVVGVYGLGKCQRVIALLREQGYQRPIYLALRAPTSKARSCLRRLRRSPTAGRGACRIRSQRSLPAGCGCVRGRVNRASSSRSSSPTMPTGAS